jgi:hypothetical protein
MIITTVVVMPKTISIIATTNIRLLLVVIVHAIMTLSVVGMD